MNILYIEADPIQPEVIMDKEQKIFRIQGRSLLVDAENFYKPVINWLKEYVKNPLDNTEFVISFDYLNSSSVRRVVEMLVVLETLERSGKKVSVKWICSRGDEIIQEKGEEIKSVVYLPFEIELK